MRNFVLSIFLFFQTHKSTNYQVVTLSINLSVETYKKEPVLDWGVEGGLYTKFVLGLFSFDSVLPGKEPGGGLLIRGFETTENIIIPDLFNQRQALRLNSKLLIFSEEDCLVTTQPEGGLVSPTSFSQCGRDCQWRPCLCHWHSSEAKVLSPSNPWTDI